MAIWLRLTAMTSVGDTCSHSTGIPNLFAGYLYKCNWKLNPYEKTVCASSARWAVKVSPGTQCVCDVCGSEVSDHTSVKKSSTMCIVGVVWVPDGEQTMTWHWTAAVLQVSNCGERKSPTCITNINRFSYFAGYNNNNNIYFTFHRSITRSKTNWMWSSFLHVSLRTIQYTTPNLKLSNGDSLVRKVTRIHNRCSRNRGYFCSSGV